MGYVLYNLATATSNIVYMINMEAYFNSIYILFLVFFILFVVFLFCILFLALIFFQFIFL